MAYIGHGEGLIGCHEVVVLEVGGDIEPGAGAAGVEHAELLFNVVLSPVIVRLIRIGKKEVE